MLELIKNWTSKDEDGASAVEYGLLVAGIAALDRADRLRASVA